MVGAKIVGPPVVVVELDGGVRKMGPACGASSGEILGAAPGAGFPMGGGPSAGPPGIGAAEAGVNKETPSPR